MPQQFNNSATLPFTARLRRKRFGRGMDGNIDCLIAGVGTGGTITGVSEGYQAENPE